MADPILLIGARGGVGAEAARMLVASGESVIATVRDADQIPDVRAAIPGLRDVMALDFRNADAVASVLKERFQHTALGGVIVCAALSPYG
ncbi:MAG: NAD(P)H-binding protein, partial [Caulobacterales bacterium]